MTTLLADAIALKERLVAEQVALPGVKELVLTNRDVALINLRGRLADLERDLNFFIEEYPYQHRAWIAADMNEKELKENPWE